MDVDLVLQKMSPGFCTFLAPPTASVQPDACSVRHVALAKMAQVNENRQFGDCVRCGIEIAPCKGEATNVMRKSVVSLALFVGLLAPSLALAGPLTLTLGWSTSPNGPVTPLSSANGPVNYFGSPDGWGLVMIDGSSASPGDPLLSVTNMLQCNGCTGTLYLWITGTGFNTASDGTVITFTANDFGSGADASQSAWWDADNNPFATTTPLGTEQTFLGQGDGAFTQGGGSLPLGPYSLTLRGDFSPGGNYTTTGGLAAPEPASLILMASGLLGLGLLQRRRLHHPV